MSQRAWHLVWIACVCIVYEAQFLYQPPNPVDEGWPLYAAKRLHEGGTLYADTFFVFPPAHDATVAAPLRLMLPSGPIVIPRIAMSPNGNASVDWSSRVDPIRLDTSPIEDPTKAIMEARCPRRVDPFPLFGAETRPVATFPDRLPSASLPASPLAPAPPPTAAPSVIDITSTLRIRFTPAGPRYITLSAPALTTPRSIVRPPW